MQTLMGGSNMLALGLVCWLPMGFDDVLVKLNLKYI